MKRFVLVLLIFFIGLSANAKIITGEVEYNAEQARGEVFENPLEPVSFNFIRNHFIDAKAEENMNCLSSGITELEDRKLAKFSDGSYGVTYRSDPLYSWFYYQGKLINFTQKDSTSYPCKITKYKPDGTVANAGYKVSESESFIFSPNGKLLAHWSGNLCYDSKNNVIMARKLIE